eukprot:CAMPEP_0114123610 /NCGR_PEP_ID=MMETSP0043_2-20121206/8315_1 /TAXON_ID=464988 /ORGANISM="Hemiselmis andersenii, Strain CCMP644" /LENGTH=121 /DNA_ID=CAMNT_0001216393 /DNA_START=234 /DNA_END=595 /DNA_ORIENTATION=-
MPWGTAMIVAPSATWEVLWVLPSSVPTQAWRLEVEPVARVTLLSTPPVGRADLGGVNRVIWVLDEDRMWAGLPPTLAIMCAGAVLKPEPDTVTVLPPYSEPSEGDAPVTATLYVTVLAAAA